MMSVVGNSTCSGFKIGLYIFNHGGNAVKCTNQGNSFLKSGRIPDYFGTNFTSFKGLFSHDTRQICVEYGSIPSITSLYHCIIM